MFLIEYPCKLEKHEAYLKFAFRSEKLTKYFYFLPFHSAFFTCIFEVVYK